jgi:hypothetical protein
MCHELRAPMSGPGSGITVLVNSTDSYDDCWPPFFALFGRYWADCPYPVVLNTERKQFSWPGLDLRSTRVAATGAVDQPTWSQCLDRALDECATDVVLYLQEDYFLNAPVRSDVVARLIDVVRAGDADCVQLHEASSPGPWVRTDDDVWEVAASAPYRLSLQAGLWRRSALRRLVRPHETPWQLEAWGSKRARPSRCRVFSVNRDRYCGPGRAVIPYEPTGVVAGRWQRDIVGPLFAAEGLDVDFARRGFATDPITSTPSPRPFPRRVLARVRSLG